MIERHLTLCANGRAALSGYASGLQFGYTHNAGLYRLGVTLADEWSGTTVRAFWHLPGQAAPLTTLVENGGTDVPALVTAQSGTGSIVFEGSDGSRTVTSASIPYTVLRNSGTDDPDLPCPGTPAWQQLLSLIRQELHAASLSRKERSLILDLFKQAAYVSSGVQSSCDALEALWNGSSAPDTPDPPDTPEQPSQPDTPASPTTDKYGTLLYKLPKATTLDGSNYLDTKIKLFADNASANWTVLAAYTGPVSCPQGLPYVLFCCCRDAGQGLLCRQAAKNEGWIVAGGRGAFRFDDSCFSFSGKTHAEILRGDGSVNVVAVTKQGDSYAFYLNGVLAWNSSLEYTFDATIPEDLSLLFGARYAADGTTIEYKTACILNDARVYSTVLDKTAVAELSETLMGG